ncbi:Aste57867_21603 [Aphanomyces stellatus]|uniref:Aste57867_21603 protein n=1 Tax=Aphanomyces stellatus TaxID=120398 RepID=A0A485LHZ3_9STRA|nr:hypothetical protein As57867_021534 [Aphanomyces stellatus]VFT98273.1 Aste57867_21603 [Aphanomyces stellatus]
MEQPLDGGAASSKHAPTASAHAYYQGGPRNSSMKPQPVAMHGYYQPEENGVGGATGKYQSPRNHHGNPNNGHVKPMKAPNAYYGNMQHMQPPPYNPAMMHMNGRYYNPHIINPPLPPLPPTNPAPIVAPSNPPINPAYEKSSPDEQHEVNQESHVYHPYPQHPAPQYHHHHQHQHPGTYNNMDGVKCHRCGEKGHIAPACPTKPQRHHGGGYTKHQPRVCKYWLNGHCQKGEDCLFVHGMLPDPHMMYAPPMHMMPMQQQQYKGPPQPYPMDPAAYYGPPVPQPPVYIGGYDTSGSSPAATLSPATSNKTAVSPHGDLSYEYQNGTDMYNAPQQPLQQGYPVPYYPQPVQYDGYGYGGGYGNAPSNPPPRQYQQQNYVHPKMYQGNYYNSPQQHHAVYGHHQQAPRNGAYHGGAPHYSRTSTPEPHHHHPAEETMEPHEQEVKQQPVQTKPTFAAAAAAAIPAAEKVEDAVHASEPTSSKTVSASASTASLQLDALTLADPTPAVPKASPTDAAKPKKKKKNKQQLQAAAIDNAAAAPVSEKGLRNDTGENNCFLNVVVQALFHLQTFQEAFATATSHTCAGDGRCVYCALTSVFARLAAGGGDMAPASSESLRKVLSAISTSPLPEERYKTGSMDDAAEAHETIVRSLHESFAVSSATQAPCTCVVHDVFGLWVGEEAVCKQCGTAMETEPYDAMVLHVATEAMKVELSKTKGAIPFDALLASVWAVAGSAKKCTSCRHDKVYESRLQLKQVPRMFTLGLTWKTNPANMATLKVIVAAIEPTMHLARVFPNLVADGLVVDDGTARLLGMYCFFGHHYMAFIYKEATHEWLSFNDTVVKRVGSLWSDVQKACVENHYQPYVLFYDVVQPAKKESVLQFTIGDFVMSVASEVDQENWRATDETGMPPPPTNNQIAAGGAATEPPIRSAHK